MQDIVQNNIVSNREDSLTLSSIEMKHSDELFNLVDRSRRSLHRWLPWVNFVQTINEMAQLIEYYERKRDSLGALTTVICHKQCILGVIGFNYVDWKHKSAALGYWLGEEHRNKGYMKKACVQMIDYGFTSMSLHKINILCATGNISSQRIPEALKFKKEGLLRQGEWLNDHYEDLYTYSMLKNNWKT